MYYYIKKREILFQTKRYYDKKIYRVKKHVMHNYTKIENIKKI